MFGSPVRARVLLVLAQVATADCTQLARVTGAEYDSIYYAANSLERAGALKSNRVGSRREFAIATDYPGGAEFLRFLKAIARTEPSYQARARTIPAMTKRWR